MFGGSIQLEGIAAGLCFISIGSGNFLGLHGVGIAVNDNRISFFYVIKQDFHIAQRNI